MRLRRPTSSATCLGSRNFRTCFKSSPRGAVNLADARSQAQDILSRKSGGDLKGPTPEEQHDQNQVNRNAGRELTPQEVENLERETTHPRRPHTNGDTGQQLPQQAVDLRTVEIRLRAFVQPAIWEPGLMGHRRHRAGRNRDSVPALQWRRAHLQCERRHKPRRCSDSAATECERHVGDYIR